jgi:hypothetical protein
MKTLFVPAARLRERKVVACSFISTQIDSRGECDGCESQGTIMHHICY